MRIALVTCMVLPEPDPDYAPLAAALARRGHSASPLAWDDPQAELHAFDLFVLRSTWNYHRKPDEFLAWCRSAASHAPLINPVTVVRWNHHKRYLAELQARGVPIVPTRWFTRGEHIDLAAILAAEGWHTLVVKPSISAASFRTRRFVAAELDEAQRFADELLAERDIMIQPYLDGFREPGERSLIWIDGEWTHAVLKRPRFAGAHEHVGQGAPPTAEERSVCDAAIAAHADRLLYARVDLVRDAHGSIAVSEVELIEPSLFFDHTPQSADRLAAVLDRVLRRGVAL